MQHLPCSRPAMQRSRTSPRICQGMNAGKEEVEGEAPVREVSEGAEGLSDCFCTHAEGLFWEHDVSEAVDDSVGCEPAEGEEEGEEAVG